MELDFDNKPIYLEIESKSNKSIIVRVLKVYNYGSTGYINSRPNMFNRKILRVITDLKDINKKVEPTTSEESSEKYEVVSQVQPNYESYYEKYLILKKELMEAKEIIYKQACEIYNLKSKL